MLRCYTDQSMKRMGPDTAPAKRLQKVGYSNVLVDCFMKGLKGRLLHLVTVEGQEC